jgi:hypothetical protein
MEHQWDSGERPNKSFSGAVFAKIINFQAFRSPRFLFTPHARETQQIIERRAINAKKLRSIEITTRTSRFHHAIFTHSSLVSFDGQTAMFKTRIVSASPTHRRISFCFHHDIHPCNTLQSRSSD